MTTHRIKTGALLLAIGASLSLGTFKASAQIVLNGDFSANASSFTAHNGDFGQGGNPTTATGWNDPGQTGIQGSTTGVGNFLGPDVPGATNDFVYLFHTPAAISQTITLAPSTQYTVDFWVGARPGASNLTNEVTVSTSEGGGSTFFGKDVIPSSSAWTPESFTFTTPGFISGSGDSLITLKNASDGNSDQTVDFTNVSITAVPEPATYALFGLGALALVIAYRRRTS
jgi:hypothetical protein